MSKLVDHALKLSPTRDEWARQDFVSSLRAHVLNDMANAMKAHYSSAIAPNDEDETRETVRAAVKPGVCF
ncbi:MAG: hypothetical protein ACFBZ9_07115 [Sphingomonadales bacterium]